MVSEVSTLHVRGAGRAQKHTSWSQEAESESTHLLAFSSFVFYSILDPSLWNGAIHIQSGRPLLSSLEMLSQKHPKVSFTHLPGASQSSGVDSRI
jgi:hypothetical protein